MLRIFNIGAAFLVVALLLAGLVGCSAVPGPRLSIQAPWSRPAAMGGNAVVYLTLVNKGNSSDALVGVDSNAADTAGLHETRMEGNLMRMASVSRIDVPAGRQVELGPGGLHIMLVGLKQDINPGDKVSLILRFEKSGEIAVEVEVVKP